MRPVAWGRSRCARRGISTSEARATAGARPEVYEIWRGQAVILMQEQCEAQKLATGRCFAVHAGPGQVVIVPPGWAHATISADPEQPLVFGAWCDRAYGFEYEGVRAHGGLAYFPVLASDGNWSLSPTPRSMRRH
ncbi:MAG: hypothetical protein HC888_16720 [Candidatus Competibacteraceae bacterium]|nr:hypothetical protein [Candidatus Competibacteraceae bacterium]